MKAKRTKPEVWPRWYSLKELSCQCDGCRWNRWREKLTRESLRIVGPAGVAAPASPAQR